MKKAITVAVIVLVLIAAGLLGAYMYWKTTPSYSLVRLTMSVKNHDVEEFEKYMDVSSLLDNLFTDVIENEMKSAGAEQAAEMQMAMGFFALLKPTLIDMTKKEVLKAVETGSFDNFKEENESDMMGGGAALGSPAAQNYMKNFDPSAVKYVKKEGQVARVGVAVKDDKGEEVVIELLMRKKDGRWQIFSIGNIVELTQRLADEEPPADMPFK